MPNTARGEVRFSAGIWRARITLKGKRRLDVELPTFAPDDEAGAQRRAEFLSAQATRLRRAGKVETTSAIELLKALGREDDAETGDALAVVDRLCGAVGDPRAARATGPTFAALAKRWTDGELASEYPDHVSVKKTSDLDAARLLVICKVALADGRAFGDLPLSRVTLAHCKAVMGALPARTKRAATRRQYGQLVSRVLAMAVFPCEHISASPLPRGFLPRTGKPPAYPYLYPTEDAALLGHGPIPLARRMLWGFLAREGCRVSEALALRVGLDVDLERGAVRLDKNKTDDPRAWALDQGVVRALRAYVELRGAETGEPLFTVETRDDKLAEQLRADLEAADVKRPELHEDGENTRKMRVHDLRGTFVTLSLANGRTETWVQDRTGHTTSAMLNRYRRGARSATELALGALQPLDQVIPELLAMGDQPTDGPRELGDATEGESEVSEIIDKPKWRNRQTRRTQKTKSAGKSGDSASDDPPATHPEGSHGPSVGGPDALDLALADALARAAAAGAWDVVTKLADELAARRKGGG